jgi:hypothetical protein
LHCYPQITFERSGQHVRGDSEEARRFGNEHFGKVLFKAVRLCFDRYRHREKGALHFERIEPGVILEGHRLSPRVFTRRTIREIAQNVHRQSFILRYRTEEDRRFALHALSNLKDGRDIKGWERKPGTRRPSICCCFDVGDAVRGLMKIGLNLVAAFCPNTPVTPETFGRAIQIIKGNSQITENGVTQNGFIHAQGVRDIRTGGNDHSFQLMHVDETWHVLLCFFGGKIGAYVRFPGPSNEEWRCATIVAPLWSKDWTFRPSPILTATTVRVSLLGSADVTPTIRVSDSKGSLEVQVVERRCPPTNSGAG